MLVPEAAGSGRALLNAAIVGFPEGWRTALHIGSVKAAAALLCLGAGFAGGVVSPTLVIGAMLGTLYAYLASLAGVYGGPLFVPVVCGMIAMTVPAVGAPLAGILFVLELSGGNYPLTVVAVLAVSMSVLTARTIGEGSYYEQQLRTHGVDITQSREQWELQSHIVAKLNICRQPLALTETLSATQAAQHLLAQHHNEVFVVDTDHRYLGIVRLHWALAPENAALPLAAICDSDVPFLRENNTLLTAMQKGADFVGERIAVVTAVGVLAGTLTESDLLRARDNIVRRLREEEC